MKNIIILIGTRPNFIKITQFKDVAKKVCSDVDIIIVHTGQHYDEKMASVFFEQFGLRPDHYLNIKPGSPNSQIAEIMVKLEGLCCRIGKPDFLLVPGDVNSALAGALFANKFGIHLGHLEAGLRSFDRSMPEEFNRVLTDLLSDLFFVTEPSGLKHLADERVPKEQIHYVGNTMIDTMVAFEQEIDDSPILRTLGLDQAEFVLMTMHRPATVDHKEGLQKMAELVDTLGKKYKIVFPIHPRTQQNIKQFGLEAGFEDNSKFIRTEPLDYFAFQKLVKHCKFIITDSGGVQEESTYRQKPCITLRPNTERPITVNLGTNTLLPFDMAQIKRIITSIEDGTYKKGSIPEMWDGKATERILKILVKEFKSKQVQ